MGLAVPSRVDGEGGIEMKSAGLGPGSDGRASAHDRSMFFCNPSYDADGDGVMDGAQRSMRGLADVEAGLSGGGHSKFAGRDGAGGDGASAAEDDADEEDVHAFEEKDAEA